MEHRIWDNTLTLIYLLVLLTYTQPMPDQNTTKIPRSVFLFSWCSNYSNMLYK